METISILDGLVLTIVSMLVVFSVLAAIWGLVELIAKIVNRPEASLEAAGTPSMNNQAVDTLAPNPKHQQVAELMALVLASEDEPNKKFEIIETKRVK